MGSSRSHSDELFSKVAQLCSPGLIAPPGSFSPSLYDTAWLAMVQKPAASGNWLFPQSFEYVLEHQLPSGAWPSYATVADGILNTASGLLALKMHLKTSPSNADWSERAQKATAALEGMLQSWDVMSNDQVGFELLITKLLSLLQEQGVEIDFPGSAQLRRLRDLKLKHLPAFSVEKAPSTLYHSLEALIGHIDFDRARRWRQKDGSMFGSPSSTAAYVINCAEWDEEAEVYLKAVLAHGTGARDGGVPSAWPTSIFDVTWVTAALSKSTCRFATDDARSVLNFLEDCLASQHGVVGFTKFAFPDADDTAKTILAIRQLGGNSDVQPLIDTFEKAGHFATYGGERNPSITTNCNVLMAMLVQDTPLQYASQILKTAKFLCRQISSGLVYDKWHLHELYWMMLVSEAFALLYNKASHSEGLMQAVLQDDIKLGEQIPLVTLQILMKILESQQADGSWNGVCELTANAVLALSSLAGLPWIQNLNSNKLTASLRSGKAYLGSHRTEWTRGRYLWVEKVTYASNLLSEAYCVAASHLPDSKMKNDDGREELVQTSNGFLLPPKLLYGMSKSAQLFSLTPLFADMDADMMRIAECQAAYALGRLQRQHLQIFPRKGMAEDKYLMVIPLSWTACSVRLGGPASFYVNSEMILISMLMFQADEFMEDAVGQFKGDTEHIRTMIRELCWEASNGTADNGETECQILREQQDTDLNTNIRAPLARFIKHILHHPSVTRASGTLQKRLAIELDTFLQAHITQLEDSRCLEKDQATPKRTYYNWVRSTSADHTSCPVAFVFYTCLLGSDILEKGKTAYVAEDLCRHLATMCRIYNDYGSLKRDRAEKNLSSADFPEIYGQDDGVVKHVLMWIAEYERRGLNMAMAELKDLCGTDKAVLSALRLFIDVTDLFGQIYVQRDIASRMK
ncbi:unnamed protein product [Discula destructiva]